MGAKGEETQGRADLLYERAACLRREGLAEDPAVACDDGGAGVIAARLDAEDDELRGRRGEVDGLPRSHDEPTRTHVCEAAADGAAACGGSALVWRRVSLDGVSEKLRASAANEALAPGPHWRKTDQADRMMRFQ